MAKARSMTEGLLRALMTGRKLTATQARDKFGFASTESVTATVRALRKRGYNIKRTILPKDHRIGRYSLAV